MDVEVQVARAERRHLIVGQGDRTVRGDRAAVCVIVDAMSTATGPATPAAPSWMCATVNAPERWWR